MYEYSKTLFPAKYFVRTDQGNHNGVITVNKIGFQQIYAICIFILWAINILKLK